MKRNRSIVLFLFPFTVSFIFSADHFPLEKAINDAFSRHIGLQQVLSRRKENEYMTKISEKSRLPVLNLGGNARYQTETISVNFPQNPLLPISMPNIEGSHFFVDVNLTVQYPLLTGGRLKSSLKLAQLSENASDHQIQLVKSQIVWEVKQIFTANGLLHAQETAVLAMKESLELHQHRLEDMVQAGLSSKADLIQNEEKRADIALILMDITRNHLQLNDRFKDLTGMDLDQINPDHREVIPSPESWEALITKHPSLELTRMNEERQKALHRLSTADYRPSLALFSELHGGTPGINMLGDEWSVYGIAGLSLKMTIFDFQRKKEQLSIFKTQQKQILYEKERLEDQLTRRVRMLYTQLHSLENQQTAHDQLIELAQQSQNHQERLWLENQASHTDYLTALEHLTQQKSRKDQLLWQIERIKGEINFALNSIEGE